MTPTELQEWADGLKLEDKWWLSIDSATLPDPVNTEQISEQMKNQPSSDFLALHYSDPAEEASNWFEVDAPEEDQASVSSSPLPSVPEPTDPVLEPVAVQGDFELISGNAPTTDKACPFCGEQILAVAQKCKHCGEFLIMNAAPHRPNLLQVPATAPVVQVAKSRGIYVLLALFIGGLFGVHNFYAGRMAPAAIQLVIMLLLGWLGVGIFINFVWVFVELFAVTRDGRGVPFS